MLQFAVVSQDMFRHAFDILKHVLACTGIFKYVFGARAEVMLASHCLIIPSLIHTLK